MKVKPKGVSKFILFKHHYQITLCNSPIQVINKEQKIHLNWLNSIHLQREGSHPCIMCIAFIGCRKKKHVIKVTTNALCQVQYGCTNVMTIQQTRDIEPILS